MSFSKVCLFLLWLCIVQFVICLIAYNIGYDNGFDDSRNLWKGEMNENLRITTKARK